MEPTTTFFHQKAHEFIRLANETANEKTTWIESVTNSNLLINADWFNDHLNSFEYRYNCAIDAFLACMDMIYKSER